MSPRASTKEQSESALFWVAVGQDCNEEQDEDHVCEHYGSSSRGEDSDLCNSWPRKERKGDEV